MSAARRAEPRAQQEPEITWKEYPRIEPGEYLAYCRRARIYRDPGFKRWTCMLVFDILSAADPTQTLASVPMWLNLGYRDKPHASARSNYLRAWVEANGGPPRRRDRLSTRVFVRRMARVVVTDTLRSAVPYSVVTKIRSWETGTTTESTSQVVNHQQGMTINRVDSEGYEEDLAEIERL